MNRKINKKMANKDEKGQRRTGNSLIIDTP